MIRLPSCRAGRAYRAGRAGRGLYAPDGCLGQRRGGRRNRPEIPVSTINAAVFDADGRARVAVCALWPSADDPDEPGLVAARLRRVVPTRERDRL